MVSRARGPQSISKSAPMRNWVFSESSKRGSKQKNASNCKKIKRHRKRVLFLKIQRGILANSLWRVARRNNFSVLATDWNQRRQFWRHASVKIEPRLNPLWWFILKLSQDTIWFSRAPRKSKKMAKSVNAATEAPMKYLRNLITKQLSLFGAQNAKTIISSPII